MPSRGATAGHPVCALALGCLMLACASAVRSTDAARGEVEDAAGLDAPARDRPTGSADAEQRPDARASADPDVQVADQAAGDADAWGLDAGADERASTLDAAAPAVPCPGYKKGTHTQPDVPTATFCAAYAGTCGYQDRNSAFASLPDCQATYDASSRAARTCRAGHLCEAIVSTGAAGRSSNCQAAAHGPTCP